MPWAPVSDEVKKKRRIDKFKRWLDAYIPGTVQEYHKAWKNSRKEIEKSRKTREKSFK